MYAGYSGGGTIFFQSGNVLKLTDEEIEREVREE